MKIGLSIALGMGSLAAAGTALADCPGPFVKDVKRAYEQAQAYEERGKQEDALRAYARAEGYVCENVNPYEADAAKRAASLGLALGGAAEKRGNPQLAYELYEAGGHFALADRAFMAVIRTKPDDTGSFQTAREHFDNRSLPAFQSNHRAAIAATGAYQPDPGLIAEVAAMPTRGAERAVQRESAAFNEQYLKEYVQLIQSRAEDMTDAGALQRTISAQQAFAQKWPDEDPMKAAQRALQDLRMWGLNGGDPELAKRVAAQFTQRADARSQLLAQKYSGAPQLLEAAMEFIRIQQLDASKADARLAALRAQAAKLGDEASAKKRYLLAAEYYDVAGDPEKAQAAREKRNQLTMQKMQPSIDAMQKQAAELQREFSDPAQVEAMRKQAEAAQKAIQQQQAASKQTGTKRADDLEKELGL